MTAADRQLATELACIRGAIATLAEAIEQLLAEQNTARHRVSHPAPRNVTALRLVRETGPPA